MPLSRPTPLARVVGCLFLWTSGIHVGIVASDPLVYRSFADGAVPAVRSAWAEVFMASPVLWGSTVALGELLIALAALRGGRSTLVGLVGAVGFHLCLMLFGWWLWLWAVPVLAVLVPHTVHVARPGAGPTCATRAGRPSCGDLRPSGRTPVVPRVSPEAPGGP